MFAVYVLRSLKNKKRYIGYTSKNPLERLNEHNRGCNKWSRENKPFVIIHVEEYTNKEEAIQRENFLKSGQGRKWLDENIEN
ncbi:MAG: GIY-YIG nuclease family protein [Patescibacteria group bacterium]